MLCKLEPDRFRVAAAEQVVAYERRIDVRLRGRVAQKRLLVVGCHKLVAFEVIGRLRVELHRQIYVVQNQRHNICHGVVAAPEVKSDVLF